MQDFNLKKFFLHLLIGSVLVSAILGIGVILFGNFGEFETRILLTTLTVNCTSILGLACGVNLAARRGKLFPISGIGLVVLSAGLWVILIWMEPKEGSFFTRFLSSTTLLAIAFSYLSLIYLARLDQRFKWALISASISVAGLTAILLGLIWFTAKFESDLTMRVLGVLSIIVATLTIVIPTFHKLSDNLNDEKVIEAEIQKLKERISELEKRKEKIEDK